jgi:hypothetical protein
MSRWHRGNVHRPCTNEAVVKANDTMCEKLEIAEYCSVHSCKG